jgi:hypothetical protein
MSRLFGPMRQVGIVVRDIEKAMRHWVEVCGVGPWFYAEQLPMDLQFRQSLARGRAEADGKVAVSLHRRAVGFTGPDGRYYPPDVNAASLWLRNRQPRLWRDKVEHEHSGSLEAQVALMPTEERLARARELIELGKGYLPLLAKVRAEREAKVIGHEPAEVAGGDSSTEGASVEPDEKDE